MNPKELRKLKQKVPKPIELTAYQYYQLKRLLPTAGKHLKGLGMQQVFPKSNLTFSLLR